MASVAGGAVEVALRTLIGAQFGTVNREVRQRLVEVEGELGGNRTSFFDMELGRLTRILREPAVRAELERVLGGESALIYALDFETIRAIRNRVVHARGRATAAEAYFMLGAAQALGNIASHRPEPTRSLDPAAGASTLDEVVARYIGVLRDPSVDLWDVTAVSHGRQAAIWGEYFSILHQRLSLRTIRLRRIVNLASDRGLVDAVVVSAGSLAGRLKGVVSTRAVVLSAANGDDQVVPSLSVFSSSKGAGGCAILDIGTEDLGNSEAAVMTEPSAVHALRRVYTEWFRKGVPFDHSRATREWVARFGQPTTGSEIDARLELFDYLATKDGDLDERYPIAEAAAFLRSAFGVV